MYGRNENFTIRYTYFSCSYNNSKIELDWRKNKKSNIKNVEKAYKIKISKKLDKGFCGKVLY